ncbi:MAG: hypothetical protein QGG63_02085 [Candidatus Pacebacteria bacterium]|jgi:hypothetical protein|nr:hypothetical protein [Candidatus Paceibacterota bacterium]
MANEKKKRREERKEVEEQDVNSFDPRGIKYRTGQRKSKAFFACTVWAISLIIFLFLGILFFGFFYGSLILFAVWIQFFTRTLKFFLVSVPKVSGLISTNLYDSHMETYETGVHFKYPWEQVEDDHYISMRMVKEHYNSSFPTNDGPKVLLGWTLQYYATIKDLPLNIAVDESTIKDGFGAVGNSYLSDRTAIKTAKEAREAVKELEIGLKALFEKTPAQVREMDKEMFLKNIHTAKKRLVGYTDGDTNELKNNLVKLKEELKEFNEVSVNVNEEFEKKDRAEKEEKRKAFNKMRNERNLERRKREREINSKEKELEDAKNIKKGLVGEIKELEEEIKKLENEIENTKTSAKKSSRKKGLPGANLLEEKIAVLSDLRQDEKLQHKAIRKMEDKVEHIERSIHAYEEALVERSKKSESKEAPLIDDCVLEELYGIDLRISSLGEVAYEDRYQKILTTEKVLRDLDKMTDRTMANSKYDEKPLTREQAYNNALIVNKNATKDVLETPGGAGEALASIIRAFGTFQSRGGSNSDKGRKGES